MIGEFFGRFKRKNVDKDTIQPQPKDGNTESQTPATVVPEESEAIAGFPSEHELLESLKKAGIYMENPQSLFEKDMNQLYECFVKKIADSQKTTSALAILWELAKDETFTPTYGTPYQRGISSRTLESLHDKFRAIVDAVAPNQEFAKQAKSF